MGKVLQVVVGIGLIATAIVTGGVTLPLIGAVSKGFLIAVGAGLALGALSQAFFGPKIPETQRGRLSLSNDPSTPRKFVFGTTAMNTDLVFYEPSGTDQEYIDYIIVVAAHKVASIDSIYFESNLAWSSGGGVSSTYSGFLTVATRTEGTSGNTVSISSNWGSDERLTGCAYVHLRIKRSKTGDTESPLVSGLPSRVTIIGEGALLYDPRLDSTRGGSGAHRADDQSTWGASYSPSDSYENPALVLLWFLLGWKINGKLSVGCGVPPARIDFDSFITVANSCDEAIALSGGGTQERYRAAGTGSDADDRLDVINTLLATMNGTLRDNSGKLALALIEDDLASYVLDFDDDDIIGPHSFRQTGGLARKRNVVRGRFTDPSTNSLYQLREYPSVELTSVDGIERMLPLDLAYVEDGIRAQRIAKQVLMRNQFRGEFSADFNLKALGCEVGDIVRVTFSKRNWTNKLFRVVSKSISFSGRVPLTLVEEDASIYAWSAEESSVPASSSVTPFDPTSNPINVAGTIADWPNVSDSAGTKPEDNADVTANAQVVTTQPGAFNIQADSTGTTTTVLSAQTRSIMVYKGGTLQTSGVTVGTTTASAGITIASASVSSGVVTVELSTADASGYVTIPVIFESKTYNVIIPVIRQVAAPPQTGGTGTTTVTDGDWTSINSTTYAQVTNDPMQVDSDGSGQLLWTYNASYNNGVVTCKAQYSTDNSTWSDFTGSETTGSTPITVPGEEEDGFISNNGTQTGMTASTTYYVRLLAKRTAGTDTLAFTGETFNVRQP